MPTAIQFPLPLLDACRHHTLVIVFGSGLSMARDVAGNFPRWGQIPTRLLDEAERQGIWTPKQVKAKRDFFEASNSLSLEDMLAELDTLKTALRSARKYRAALTALFRPVNAAPGDIHRALADAGANVLLTTNYDELLESVEGPPTRRAYTWRRSDQALEDIQGDLKVLFKIHGTVGDDNSVVMTRAEYDKARAHDSYRRTMSYLLQTYTFLLVGYGINDPLDLDLVFELNAGAFGSAARTHYALMKGASPTDRDRWQREMNVQVLPYDDHGDLPAILRVLQTLRTSQSVSIASDAEISIDPSPDPESSLDRRQRSRLEHLVRIPDDPNSPTVGDPPHVRYEYRGVRGYESVPGFAEPLGEDMQPFVDISEESDEIAHANASLTSEQRQELYMGWWQRNPKIFLMLDRMEGGQRETIAISILLPLSREMAIRVIDGEVNVVDDLRGYGLNGIEPPFERPQFLLYDTWAVRKKYKARLRGRELAIIFKHLSRFWDPDRADQRTMTFLIEPDNRRLEQWLVEIHFGGPHKTRKGSRIYRYVYPDPHLNALQATCEQQIADHVRRFRRDEAIAANGDHLSPPVTPPCPPTPLLQRAPSPMRTLQRPLDLGVVVALPEELREFLQLAGRNTPHYDANLDSYLFERGPYRCTATLVGDMGEAHATRVTERLIALWDPGSVVVVGIAAGVHDDLRVGDVHVAPQAVEYMQDAKAAATASGGFTIVPGAPAYRADYALLAAVRRFEFSESASYRRWLNDGHIDLEALVPDASARDRLFASDLVRRDPRLLADGHVATGPVVGASAAFSAWIRTHDRNIKALEMESAAVLLAAQTRSAPKRALAIRGISDYGDDRKQALDGIGGGTLRRYAMRNAVRLLLALLDAGSWPRESTSAEM